MGGGQSPCLSRLGNQFALQMKHKIFDTEKCILNLPSRTRTVCIKLKIFLDLKPKIRKLLLWRIIRETLKRKHNSFILETRTPTFFKKYFLDEKYNTLVRNLLFPWKLTDAREEHWSHFLYLAMAKYEHTRFFFVSAV